MAKARPFQIAISDEVLQDLRNRLIGTRWPTSYGGHGWSRGTDVEFLKDLCAYWAREFDWRAQEDRLNRLSQFTMPVNGLETHFVHVRSPEPSAIPLVLTHGWPGTFAEFAAITESLADPAAHGGDARDAFHVVLPSIPGYGFSEAPGRPGYTIRDVGRHISDLMVGLGYDRFGAQGGDWGAMATENMALATPERLIGIHLNLLMVDPPSTPGSLDGISERVRLGLERMAQFEASGGSLYWRIHGTTPTTLTPGLSDSPAGLASWIVEKFNWWTDNQSNLFDVIPRDDLLTHLTIYWVTNTIGSSIDLYYETVQHAMPGGPHKKVEVPTSVLVLPKELVTPDRRWIDPMYNIVRWTEHDSGGHFAAMELPELFVEDVRAAFRPYR